MPDNEEEVIVEEQGQEEEEAEEKELSYDELSEMVIGYREKLDNQSRKFQEATRERDIVRSSYSKLTKTLKELDIADIDDNLNIIFKKSKEETKENTQNIQNPVEEITNKIAEIKRRYKNDEIESDDYFEQLSDLKSKQNLIEFQNTQKQQAAQEAARQRDAEKEASKSSRNNSALNILNTDYSDHQNTESDLFRLMNEIYMEDPTIWNGNLADDAVDRLKLAKMAKSRLNKENKKVTNEPKKNQTTSFDSTSYRQPEAKKHTYGSEVVLKSGIKDEAIKKSLLKEINTIENLPQNEAYFIKGMNSTSLDI